MKPKIGRRCGCVGVEDEIVGGGCAAIWSHFNVAPRKGKKKSKGGREKVVARPLQGTPHGAIELLILPQCSHMSSREIQRATTEE